MTYEDDHSKWNREKIDSSDRHDDARSYGKKTRQSRFGIWGWRIPFLLSALILVVLFILLRH